MINIITITVDIMTCIGVIIALFNFSLTRKATLAEHERNEKFLTIEILKEYEEKFHKYDRIIYKKYKGNSLSYDEIINDKKVKNAVWNYLNDLEFICTGINIGIYDIHTMDRMFGDVILRIYHLLFPYIEGIRRQSSTNIVCVELEKVVQKIEKRQKESGTLLNKEGDIKYKL